MKRGACGIRVVFLLLAIAGCGYQRPSEVPLSDATERVWLGPDFYANRLQDWRLEDSRIVSVEGRARKPMRTVHLLSRTLDDGDGEFVVSAIVENAGVSGSPDNWGGFLLGAGSGEIDFRISVLTHHWPAPGGGVIAAVDGRGRLILRDNSRAEGLTGARSDYTSADWPVLGIADSVSGPIPDRARLEVSGIPSGDGYDVVVRLLHPETGEELAGGLIAGVDPEFMSGTVALASHGSPLGDDRGYAFSDWRLSGSKVVRTPERVFGPVLGLMYTQSRGTLKLTAQFGPLGPADSHSARLEQRSGSRWTPIAEASIAEDAYTATFRVEGWDPTSERDVRVVYDLRVGEELTETRTYEGHVRAEPRGRPFLLGGLNCHHISGGDGSWTHNHFWYPHAELSALVKQRDPDMLFFAGDQIYESGLEGIVRTPTDTAILDYLNHWNRFVWAFGDLTRNRPTVATPDDHDVYHGNVWGAGGKAATGPFSPASDNGGYIMAPEFVNVVHRTQTSHLPDPVDPTPILQDISVYYTDMQYGGISFAILADRMWKSAPRVVLPDANIWNGWSRDLSYDAAVSSDVAGAELLGPRQEAFLDTWADDWSGGTWMKVVLSQTPFANVASIPKDALNGSVIPGLPNPAPGEYLEGYKKAMDHDSGGWPQTPRDRAIRSMRRAFSVHIAGDQHLGTVLQYGVDEFRDGGFVFTLPSIANIWPRRWFPPEEGGNRDPSRPRYTGDHLDGFGNRMTVLAVANPVDAGVEPKALYDRTPGFGLIRFDPSDRSVTFESWPRWIDPEDPAAEQYADWPISFGQEDGYARHRAGYLPAVSLDGVAEPVVRVDDETTSEWLYTIRSPTSEFRPWVFEGDHSYRVRLSEPDEGVEQVLTGQTVIPPDPN
jgi:alkaline phosphatase D